MDKSFNHKLLHEPWHISDVTCWQNIGRLRYIHICMCSGYVTTYFIIRYYFLCDEFFLTTVENQNMLFNENFKLNFTFFKLNFMFFNYNFTFFNMNFTFFNLDFTFFKLNLTFFNFNFTFFNLNFTFFKSDFTFFNLNFTFFNYNFTFFN